MLRMQYVSLVTLIAASIVACGDGQDTVDPAAGGPGGAGGASGPGGTGGGGGLTSHPSFKLTHAGDEIAHGTTYALPDGFGNESASAAIFSELKDSMSIRNDGDASIVVTAVTVTPHDGVMEEEFAVCGKDSTTNECQPFMLPTLGSDERSDLIFQFYPIASDMRAADLRFEYTVDDARHVHDVVLQGWGRVGSNEYPATLLSGGLPQIHKLWGGYDSSHDEAPGPMVADADGNITIAGTVTAYGSSNSADRNIFVVRLSAAGELAWARMYESSAHDEIAQAGDNLLIGIADAMDVDDEGNVYLAARAGNGMNKYVGMIAKIAPNGSEVWTRYWHGNTERLANADAASAYALDVEGDAVYFTGIGKSDVSTTGIPIVALDTDGNYRWSKLLIPQGAASSAHRGHTIRADGTGNVYVGGIDYTPGSSGPFLAKLSGADVSGNNIAVAWSRVFDGETAGTNFNTMALDGDGNIYLGMDRRGAATFFTVVKVDSDGSSSDGTTMPGQGADRQNIHVVRHAGDHVYAGGRTGLAGWDTGRGDGIFVRLNKNDLSLDRGGIYYTGSGPNEICTHLVNGIAANGDDVWFSGQVYSGNLNIYRYWGYWYEFPLTATPYAPMAADTTGTTQLIAMPLAAFVSGADDGFANDGSFSDIPASLDVEFQDAADKNETTNGTNTDGDLYIMKMTLD